METKSKIDVLESQIRECYVWTYKVHEKCSDILSGGSNTIKIWQIILSAITLFGIVAVLLIKSMGSVIVAIVISIIPVGLNIYVKKYDVGDRSRKHADATSSIWNIREKYLSLLTDIRAGVVDVEEIRIAREKLQYELHKTYKGSPITLAKAYEEASKALEEMAFSDEKIDEFLPKSLRRNKEPKLSDEGIKDFPTKFLRNDKG
jgi:hypothetical protein